MGNLFGLMVHCRREGCEAELYISCWREGKWRERLRWLLLPSAFQCWGCFKQPPTFMMRLPLWSSPEMPSQLYSRYLLIQSNWQLRLTISKFKRPDIAQIKKHTYINENFCKSSEVHDNIQRGNINVMLKNRYTNVSVISTQPTRQDYAYCV